MTRYRIHRRIGRVKDLVLTLCFLVLLTLIAARLSGPGTQEVFVGPFRVVDGDTLASGPQRLRLSGIDAPELDQTCARKDGTSWPCGFAARDALAQLMAGAATECRGHAMDRYRRILVSCYSAGQTVNGRMVASGQALATDALTFRKEQSQAEAQGRGIWSGTFEHPRLWRQRAGVGGDEEEFGGFWQRIRNLVPFDWL